MMTLALSRFDYTFDDYSRYLKTASARPTRLVQGARVLRPVR